MLHSQLVISDIYVILFLQAIFCELATTSRLQGGWARNCEGRGSCSLGGSSLTRLRSHGGSMTCQWMALARRLREARVDRDHDSSVSEERRYIQELRCPNSRGLLSCTWPQRYSIVDPSYFVSTRHDSPGQGIVADSLSNHHCTDASQTYLRYVFPLFFLSSAIEWQAEHLPHHFAVCCSLR